MKKLLILFSILFLCVSCIKKSTELSQKTNIEYIAKVSKLIEKLELIKDWSIVHYEGHCWITTFINRVEITIFASGRILINNEEPKMITMKQQEKILKIYNKYDKCIKRDPLDEVLK